MRVVEPVQMSESNLISSNITENDAHPWNSDASYSAGDLVIRNHVVYLCVIAEGSTTLDPSADSENEAWVSQGATNLWKPFDRLLSDPATNDGDITYTIQPVLAAGDLLCDTVAVFNMVGQTVRIRIFDNLGAEIKDETRTLIDNSAVIDGWTWSFEPIKYETNVILSGIPLYLGYQVEITVSAGGNATSVGQIVVGRNQKLGETLVGTSIGFTDYSRKERDDFGNAVLVERPYSNRVVFEFAFPTTDAQRVRGIIARMRATPAIYFAGEDTSIYGTTIYGFPRDFDTPLSTNQTFANLEVEGLT